MNPQKVNYIIPYYACHTYKWFPTQTANTNLFWFVNHNSSARLACLIPELKTDMISLLHGI